ncbi:hypothetical protein [Streptomyces chryseus]
MEAVIDAFRDDDENDVNRRQAHRSQFGVSRATWQWPGGSVADTFLARHRPDLVGPTPVASEYSEAGG